MPQPKVHADNAGKQAAYRSRKGRPQPRQSELAALARNLHYVIRTAVACSDFALPHEILGVSADQTMVNLMRHFNTIYDPICNPKGRFKPERDGTYLLLPADWDTLDWDTQAIRLSEMRKQEEVKL